MKHERIKVEFLISHLSLTKRLVSGKITKHLIAFQLIWPRPQIRSRDFTRIVEVDKQGNMSKDLAWDQKIICKETIQGPFALKIGIYKNMSSSKMTEFVTNMISESTEEIGEYLGDLIDIPLASDLVELPFDYISDKIDDSSEKCGIIGSTCINMEFFPEQETVNATAELTSPKDFYTTKKINRAGKRHSIRKKILKKGEKIGRIGITFKVYE